MKFFLSLVLLFIVTILSIIDHRIGELSAEAYIRGNFDTEFGSFNGYLPASIILLQPLVTALMFGTLFVWRVATSTAMNKRYAQKSWWDFFIASLFFTAANRSYGFFMHPFESLGSPVLSVTVFVLSSLPLIWTVFCFWIQWRERVHQREQYA